MSHRGETTIKIHQNQWDYWEQVVAIGFGQEHQEFCRHFLVGNVNHFWLQTIRLVYNLFRYKQLGWCIIYFAAYVIIFLN